MKNEVVQLAKKIRLIFESHKEKVDLPHFYGFPENSCEGASCYLGFFLLKEFPSLKIEVIHGDNGCDEHHFWVEVNGKIYDITVDQFLEVDSPVYEGLIHPLANRFKFTERKFASIAMLEYEGVEEERKNNVYSYIQFALDNEYT